MNIFSRVIIALIESFRPMLGAPYTCIYWEESCGAYAKRLLKTRSWYIAIPYITFRILSCNPITALFLYMTKS